MLDYRLVQAFAAVASEGGFEKAAGVLHLTQSAVSQRIKLLEEQMGCVLLVRASPPRPTRPGKALLRHYRQVKRLEEDLGPGLGRNADQTGFTTLPVGVNADSLATWFFPALDDYLDSEPVLLDLRVDDQAETHGLLRDGEVLGCVSDRTTPFQGCRVVYLGDMDYRLYSTPEYKSKWFPHGEDSGSVHNAPLLIFNRKDRMHEVILEQALGEPVSRFAAFYLPSSEQFAPAILSGRVCGMLPDQQAAEHTSRGELVDLLPGHVFTVRLHWHCWNLQSPRLEEFTTALTKGARRLLPARSG